MWWWAGCALRKTLGFDHLEQRDSKWNPVSLFSAFDEDSLLVSPVCTARVCCNARACIFIQVELQGDPSLYLL